MQWQTCSHFGTLAKL